MNTPDSVIKDLEADNSRIYKESVVAREMRAGNTEFFDGARLALDCLISFGVKKVPIHGGPDGQGLPWVAFLELANLLRTRQLTGHAARDAIELALGASTQSQWNNWYRRILIKDLRCGVSEKTINNVAEEVEMPQYAVPVFECQLAHDGTKHEKKIKGKKLIDIKLDGVRCLTVINAEEKTVRQYSRNGQPLENFGHITQALEARIDEFDRSWVLDGEMMSADFQTLMTQLKRKKDVQASDSVLNLFDIIPLSEFRAGKSTMGQRRRTALLKSFKPVFDKVNALSVLQSNTLISVIEPEEVDLDTPVGQMQFEEINRKALAAGFEGIMLKDPNAPYECKRSTSWLKVKPFITVDLAIVAAEEGTGKNAGRLGAIVCEGIDQGRAIKVNVGSGISDEEREEWWRDVPALIGQVVEVAADAVTQNQDGTYSLRFPRFKRFRGFTAGEKI